MKPIALKSITCLRSLLVFSSLLVTGWTSQANIVGYVNVALTNGYNYVANPLRASTNDSLTNIVRFAPQGSRAYVWDVDVQAFSPAATRDGSGWSTNYALPVGRGFVLYAPLKWTNTFVGEVLEGMLTNVIAGNNQYTLVGNKLPGGGPISAPGFMGFPIIDGASVHFFRSASQTFSGRYYAFTNYGWFDPDGIIGADGPTNMVAESFFVQNPGPKTLWTNFFSSQYRSAANATATAEITALQIENGKATLEWAGAGGAHYDIRFSIDGEEWITVAARQSGNKWAGKLPAADAGRFEVVLARIIKKAAK